MAAHTTEFLDLRRAVQQFPIGRRTLWQLVKDGRLTAFRFGGKLLVRRADLEALLVANPYRRRRDDDGGAQL